MDRPQKSTSDAIDTFLAAHPDWRVAGGGLERTYAFTHYGAAVAFAVHVAFAAERRDHHPELHISWGEVRVVWSTHDAGGISALDLEMADLTDRAHLR